MLGAVPNEHMRVAVAVTGSPMDPHRRESPAGKQPSRPADDEGVSVDVVTVPAWQLYAGALLQREALLCRISRGRGPDGLAGLRIDDERVEALLAELVGDVDTATLGAARDRLEPIVEQRRTDFVQELSGGAALATLVGNARLSDDEAAVLAVLCAVDLDPRLQRLVAFLNDDVQRSRPTLDLLRRLFGPQHPGPLAVGPDARLCRAALARVEGSGPWGAQVAAVEPSVMWALAGDPSMDPELPVGVRIYEPGVPVSGDLLVLVTGDDPTRRRQLAAAAIAGSRFLVTPEPGDDHAWRAVVREATVRGIGVIVEVDDTLHPDSRRWIDRATHLPWAVSARFELPLPVLPGRRWRELHATADEPTDEEWTSALGPDVPRGHRLTAQQLELVATAYEGLDHDLDAAVRRLASGRIDQLATRIRPRRSWADVVLPPYQLAQLRELVARYRQRERVYGEWGFPALPSAGLVGLFSGPSGTGKSLSAEVIAADLGLDLFKIDLSSVVSKYIGETEKNLEEIFDAASAGNLVLFFDEADSIFGKRSEVSDAKDRYANIETSYLLQRLERYDGLVLLATNLQKNIDQAFVRRIDVAVEFTVPEESERRAIWRHCFPESAPLGDVDFDFLAARFKIAGGSIKKASLYAAFLAADAGTEIDMRAVAVGLAREYQKLGRLRTPEDFGPYYELVSD